MPARRARSCAVMPPVARTASSSRHRKGFRIARQTFGSRTRTVVAAGVALGEVRAMDGAGYRCG